MDTLCINNIYVYPGIKPPKGIISREFILENITIWISKCNNIYFNCTNKHPMSGYGINESTYLLPHLFYLITNLVIPQDNEQKYSSLLNNFLQGCIEYMKIHSSNAYLESQNDPIISLFYYQVYMPILVNPYSLSFMKNNIQSIKYQHHTLKNKATKCFDNFKNDFEEMSKKIIDKINDKKIEKKDIEIQVSIEKNDVNIQTNIVKNVWTKKSIETQTILDKKDITIQTDINKLTDSLIQTEIIQTEIIVNESIKDNKKKKKKVKDEETYSFTEKEYALLMVKHKEDVEEARKDGYERYKKNFSGFVTESKLPPYHLYSILNASETDPVIDAIITFNLNFTVNQLRLGIIKVSGRLSTIPAPFYSFWNEIIIPNKDRLDTKFFEILINEWDEMLGSIRNCKVKINPEHYDFIFEHFGIAIMTDCWDLQFCIPSFFNILFRKCRNIPVLFSMINSSKTKLSKEKKIELVRDFSLLYTIPSEKEILYDNRHKLDIDPNILKILYFQQLGFSS